MLSGSEYQNSKTTFCVFFAGQVQRVDQRQIVAKDNIVTILISVVVAIVVVVGGICAICCFRSKIKNWLYHKSSEIYESRSASSSIGSGKSCVISAVFNSF